ncbi:MAG: hypothetical protein K0S56_4819 [Microvirga sp.]|nr:hypothetical protein [Microvirga sp.]
MAGFDERKDAFEKKFAHDEELRFKATARRNKLFGLWAAEQLGKSGTDADAYAKSVVLADFEEAGDADVLRKVQADLSRKFRRVARQPCRLSPEDRQRLVCRLVSKTALAFETVLGMAGGSLTSRKPRCPALRHSWTGSIPVLRRLLPGAACRIRAFLPFSLANPSIRSCWICSTARSISARPCGRSR